MHSDSYRSLPCPGLDAVAAGQMATAIAEKLGQEVPKQLLLEHPSIPSLTRYGEAARATPGRAPAPAAPVPAWEQMQADSVLPPDIHPEHGSAAPDRARAILLTGATGFLGAYLLRALLRETTAHVYCLVRRGRAANAHGRLQRNLESYDLWEPAHAARVHPLAGNLLRPGLGLPPDQFAWLSGELDAIYHAAAAVNWVLPYERLRETNVRGTVELLRLACRSRPKPFHLVSTLSVCYATSGPAAVREQDDPFTHLRGLHLGYAQSKCVAETLVRRASERGLPVTIHRPTLLSGDSRSGCSNTADFLAAMIKGCIHMRSAPDLDWNLDCCPVDHAAEAIVRLSRTASRKLRIFHLLNAGRRHWRELVLWMNLFGYPLRLVPYRDWLARLDAEATTADHPLYALRSFFLTRPVGAGGLTFPELYEESRRSRACDQQTRTALSGLALACPALTVRLLDRTFGSLIERGFLPPVSRSRPRGQQGSKLDLGQDFFGPLLRRFYGDESLDIRSIFTLPAGSNHSLLTELTSWRHGTSAGLSRFRIELEAQNARIPRQLELFVKVKPRDEQIMDVGASVAAACGAEIGEVFARYQERTGLAGCHLRELALYQQQDERFRKHAPAVYGVVRDDERQHWVLVLERLPATAFLVTEDGRGWRKPCIEVTLRGLADLQAIWFGREAELLAQPWLGAVFSAQAMSEMRELWQVLGDHAARTFTDWLGPDYRVLQRDLLASVGQCWRRLEALPRTLIHNDFNPRNLALRRVGRGRRLCAFDWELATLGVPQHDLAEFLCFTLTPACQREELLYYLEFQRQALARATGAELDAGSWREGFRLSLYDLLLNRLPLYCLIHTFRRQPFLERVLRTWHTLYHHLQRHDGARVTVSTAAGPKRYA